MGDALANMGDFANAIPFFDSAIGRDASYGVAFIQRRIAKKRLKGSAIKRKTKELPLQSCQREYGVWDAVHMWNAHLASCTQKPKTTIAYFSPLSVVDAEGSGDIWKTVASCSASPNSLGSCHSKPT